MQIWHSSETSSILIGNMNELLDMNLAYYVLIVALNSKFMSCACHVYVSYYAIHRDVDYY